ncbi:hypothetical protein GUITHDRAFT_151803 [Guillardia theta CCMP2712]|uniref:Uncharacterized protein n=1 Tax=Guillardia theta (strain CCMP2712) TaxID=905079 RepID=L1JKD0_GUITC|nr:hypothetical protein GUITHDRAFT_151803 [Guillardia theta CCMP2712]EKX48619.1 hypothetical protein GUITHDRAFT_151803 [Guillardia theta CCMP2712]|eukprot:XP_005835599.1 hypothetical protein GUITHDRAFT_151803 [Guillardia theta CCMP2712]
MKMLNWDMPPPSSPPAWSSPAAPKEWFKVQLPTSKKDNDDVDSAEGLVQKMVAEKGLRTEWVKVVEFSFLALALSSILAVGPSFIDAWVQRVDPSSVREPQGPSGVDAFLIQTDFSKDRLVLPNGLDDCDHVLPRFITRCSPREGEVKPETRQKVLSWMAQGKGDAEILSMEEVKGAGVSSSQVQAIRQEFVQVKARKDALGRAGGGR